MKSFKDLVENKVSVDDATDALYNAMDTGDSKFDQALWDLLEPLGAVHGLYGGDATPDEIIDVLTDKEILKVYKELNKKYKKLMNESAKISKASPDRQWAQVELKTPQGTVILGIPEDDESPVFIRVGETEYELEDKDLLEIERFIKKFS
jgi:hypothetical protein